MSITRALTLLAFGLCSAVAPGSHFVEAETDMWQPLRPFLGKWEGDVRGEPGNGKAERSYAFVLRDRFIQITNKSVYPLQEKNPKGEIHEDIGFISYDRGAKKFALRQFHVEGFVNEFKVETFDPKERRFVFVTTSIENIAPGWRARETYHFLNENEFVETFALAEPGMDFATYSETHFRRKRAD
jgi:hypothetical protein